jgi:hypothetical protein
MPRNALQIVQAAALGLPAPHIVTSTYLLETGNAPEDDGFEVLTSPSMTINSGEYNNRKDKYGFLRCLVPLQR